MYYRLSSNDEFIVTELKKTGTRMTWTGMEAKSVSIFTLQEAQSLRDKMIKENPFFSRIRIEYA